MPSIMGPSSDTVGEPAEFGAGYNKKVMSTRYEYIRLRLDFGDLEELNRLGGEGWRVVAVVPSSDHFWALLEREHNVTAR